MCSSNGKDGVMAKKKATKKKATEGRRPRNTGGLVRKTGQWINATTGEPETYEYFQATREVPVEKLPAGVNRKRISGNGRTEREALTRLDANWLAFISGKPTPRTKRQVASNITLQELFNKWDFENKRGRVSLQMRSKYESYFRNHILPDFGTRLVESITEGELLDHFNEDLLKKVNPKTGKPLLSTAATRNIYMAMSGCFDYGVRHGFLTYNRVKGVPAPKKPEPDIKADTASENARRLLEVLSANKDGDYCRFLFQYLGLRRSERIGLSWDDIDGLDSPNGKLSMTVRRQLARHPDKGVGFYIKHQTKTSRQRFVVIPEPFASALREHKAQQDVMKRSPQWKPKREFANLVFLQPDGSIYTQNRDNRDWAKLLKENGFPYWRGHLNRFITAIWLASQKPPVPIGTVMAILGHQSEAMNFYYARTSRDQQQEPMAQYGANILEVMKGKS